MDIKSQLDRIADLSDDELTGLEDSIISEFGTLKDAERTAQTVDSMVELADAADVVKAEKARRAQQAAELGVRADEAAARIGAQTDEAETEGDEPEAPVAEEERVEEAVAASNSDVAEPAAPVAGSEASVDTTAQGEPDKTVAESTAAQDETAEAPADAEQAPAEKETVTAAASDEGDTDQKEKESTVTAAATPQDPEPAVQAPADRQPRAQVLEATVAITAGADIPGVSAGSPLENMKSVAKAMSERMHQMRRTSGGDGEQHTVATLVASYPAERTLVAGDVEGNRNKIDAVASPKALAASGGLCAPVEVRYDMFGIGDTDRPVKDALPTFNADRGGIRFMTPPTLADFEGVASLWTLQDDIDAATPGAPDPVKPCIRIACGAEVTVFTDAIPLCLTFGNLNARAYPELIERHNELALIQQARFAETRLLTRIGALSTAITAGYQLSAAVDFLGQVDRAQASYRNRHRVNSIQAMRVIAPVWMKDMIRADLSKRMPGDGLDANLMVADAQIDAFFRARNVNVTWTLDGETGQVFGAQAAGPLQDFPDNVVWYMFAEGTFLFLDGGTLDLGLVRDSTLNGTNDYKMFVETFEGVAKVGIESLRVTSRLASTGMVAGTLDTRPANVR